MQAMTSTAVLTYASSCSHSIVNTQKISIHRFSGRCAHFHCEVILSAIPASLTKGIVKEGEVVRRRARISGLSGVSIYRDGVASSSKLKTECREVGSYSRTVHESKLSGTSAR